MWRVLGDRAFLAGGYAMLLLAIGAWWQGPLAPGAAGPLAPLIGVWIAAAILLMATWWVGYSPEGSGIVSRFALAASAQLAAVSIVALAGAGPTALGWTIAALAVLPLSWALAGMAGGPSTTRYLRALALVAVIAATAISWLGPMVADAHRRDGGALADLTIPTLRWALLTIAVGLAALAGALNELRSDHLPRRSVIPTAIALVSIALAVSAAGLALVVPWWPLLVGPSLAVAATAVVLGLVAIRPLEAEAGVALSQRDLIVAAADAERYRMASALHDGPLGDLALLVQRLDATGDMENAMLARTVAADLRALGNDLRVPVLDDLGAAPAIEWLVERVAERTHMTIHTELRATLRPPGEVELAVYRIAQEALMNAVRHGRGPVRVRYVSDPRMVELSVSDAGPGLDREAPVRAVREGRLGLLLMRQRAEAIGGQLVLRTLGSGGTEVGLTWAPTPH